MRTFLSFIIIVVMLVGGMLYLLNSTWMVNFVVPKIINNYWKDIELESFHVTRQKYRYPGTIQLFGMGCKVNKEGLSHQVSFRALSLKDVLIYRKSSRKINLVFAKLNVQGPWGEVRNLDLALQVNFRKAKKIMSKRRIKKISGDLVRGDIQAGQYRLRDTMARLEGDREHLQIVDINAQGYGGTLQGQVLLEHSTGFNYIFWMEMFGLDPSRLQNLSPELFTGLEGSVDGTVRINGNQHRIDLLAINLIMPEGGTIRSPLKNRIIEQLKDQEQKQRLNQLWQAQKKFIVDKAALNIHGADETSAKLTINLENKQNDIYIINSVPVKLTDVLKTLNIKNP